MIRTLPEDALIGGLADERDGAQRGICADLLEALECASEVPGPQIARATGRPPGCVREPDAEREKLMLLARLEKAGREPNCVEQAPEVVARVREVRGGGSARASRVDPAEDDPDTGA